MPSDVPPHPVRLDIVGFRNNGEKYKLWDSSVYNFLHTSVTYILVPNILLNMFSDAFSLLYSVRATEQFLHPY